MVYRSGVNVFQQQRRFLHNSLRSWRRKARLRLADNTNSKPGWMGFDGVGGTEQDRKTMNTDPHSAPAWLTIFIPIVILLALWDMVWKLIGMWKSGRNNQLA